MVFKLTRNIYVALVNPFIKEIPNRNYVKFIPGIFVLDFAGGKLFSSMNKALRFIFLKNR